MVPGTDLPPARLSVSDLSRPDCPVTWEDVQQMVIRLDGVEQHHVVEYDCEAGTVLRHKLDSDGNIQINPEKRDEVWTEEVTGHVTVGWR